LNFSLEIVHVYLYLYLYLHRSLTSGWSVGPSVEEEEEEGEEEEEEEEGEAVLFVPRIFAWGLLAPSLQMWAGVGQGMDSKSFRSRCCRDSWGRGKRRC
jgi:hypothetical protein